MTENKAPYSTQRIRIYDAEKKILGFKNSKMTLKSIRKALGLEDVPYTSFRYHVLQIWGGSAPSVAAPSDPASAPSVAAPSDPASAPSVVAPPDPPPAPPDLPPAPSVVAPPDLPPAPAPPPEKKIIRKRSTYVESGTTLPRVDPNAFDPSKWRKPE